MEDHFKKKQYRFVIYVYFFYLFYYIRFLIKAQLRV